MALTVDQMNLVKELATLAYGTGGSSERTAGGKGNMGLIYDGNGNVHVVKFNTHGSDEAHAQRDALAGRLSQNIVDASNALRNEIRKIAQAAELNAAEVDQLLSAEGKPLVTRKVVAAFVSKISTDDLEDFRNENIWDFAQGIVAGLHLKSAKKMSFEDVTRPDEAHQKYYRQVDRLNHAVVDELSQFDRAWKSLRPDGLMNEEDAHDSLFRGIDGWQGTANSELTRETEDAARRHVATLKANGYGWMGEGKTLKQALVAELMRQGRELGYVYLPQVLEQLANDLLTGGLLAKNVRNATSGQVPTTFAEEVAAVLRTAGVNLAEVKGAASIKDALKLDEVPAAMDAVTIPEGTPYYAKTFDLYVRGVKNVAPRSPEVQEILSDAQASAAKRGAAEPDVHDFLSAYKFNPNGNGAMKVLHKLGCPLKEMGKPGLMNDLCNLLIQAGTKSLGDFIKAIRDLAEKYDIKAAVAKNEDELKMALLKAVIDAAPDKLAKTKYVKGVFGAEESFTYTHEGANYTSITKPNQQLLHAHNCRVESRGATRPLLGLSVSSLTVQGPNGTRTLSTVNRFGTFLSEKHDEHVANYKSLAAQTFLASPRLRAKVAGGARMVEVPIYRLDMALETGRFKLPDENEILTAITFTDEDGAEKTVTLVPKVHYMQLPVDSYAGLMEKHMGMNGGRKPSWVSKPDIGSETVLDVDRIKALQTNIAELVKEAETAAPGLDETTRREVNVLKEQLKVYGEHLKNKYIDQNANIMYDRSIGHEMFRMGSRLALLASKLGLTPSINCNLGRDRTGAMDNEIKMLALQLAEGKELAPIQQDDEQNGDQDKAIRSELTVKNGESDLARQINLQTNPVNVNQSNGIMNFNVLFDEDVLKRN